MSSVLDITVGSEHGWAGIMGCARVLLRDCRKGFGMDKHEILEKSREDNGLVDERFRSMEQRMLVIVGSTLMLGLAILQVWDRSHGLETNGINAVFMAGVASMGFAQYSKLRMKGALFLGAFAAVAAVIWAVQHVLITM